MTQNADLATVAREMLRQAYAPYSGYRVGAALETESGEVFGACNVENASYGLTICAERAAAAKAVSAGHRRFRRLVVATEGDRAAPPCGACCQFVAEFGGDIVVHSVAKQAKLSSMLKDLNPHAFQGGLLGAGK
ncbi:MAG: cytidine deaminase [Gemmatimonadetes bacterium]|nr:cytidine deaminase [Gemmatimonadota bacterium]